MAVSNEQRHLFAIYGASGCGRSVMPVAASMLASERRECDYEIVFVDDAPRATLVNGRRVLTYRDFLNEPALARHICIAIAGSDTRARLAARCERDGVESFKIVAANTIIMDDVIVGAGSILSPFVTIASNVRIGRYFHGNLYSYVEHDCVIGDFVTFGPGAKCNGNVRVEDHAYLGAGCVLRQGAVGKPLVIGRGAVVGMGAVVTKDVLAGEVVVGNPAKPQIKSD
jgi:sugar O-acyltransferase (sialic acid O-acetyltransferase NeuD family)